MNRLVRVSLAAFAAAGVAITMTTAASADHRPDRESGEAEVVGVGPEARDAAISGAIADWKREVAEEIGHLPRWRTATEKEIKCEVEGGRKTECEVEARPGY